MVGWTSCKFSNIVWFFFGLLKLIESYSISIVWFRQYKNAKIQQFLIRKLLLCWNLFWTLMMPITDNKKIISNRWKLKNEKGYFRWCRLLNKQNTPSASTSLFLGFASKQNSNQTNCQQFANRTQNFKYPQFSALLNTFSVLGLFYFGTVLSRLGGVWKIKLFAFMGEWTVCSHEGHSPSRKKLPH